MRLKKGGKALSTLFTVLLILLSAIIGGLIAYMWTMAPFYFEPENTVDVIVTDAVFPVDHGDYFNLTVMNPSHSISGTNIEKIYVTNDNFTELSVSNTDPELPIFLDKGTSVTITCQQSWGIFAGENLTIHVLTANKTGATRSVLTQAVNLELTPAFDVTRSIRYFNLTVTNQNSPINLTLRRVYLDLSPVENLSITLPVTLQPNETVTFTCFASWRGHENPGVKVETSEGYTFETRQNVSGTADLQIQQVNFDETNTNQIRIKLFNSEDSATALDVTQIVIAHDSLTETLSGTLTNPALPLLIPQNKTVTLICDWDWTNQSYRNIDVNVTAYSREGFESQARFVRTPAMVAAQISEVLFDLDDTGTFYVNVSNLFYSLKAINVSRILLDQDAVNMTSTLINPDEQSMIACAFNWSGLVGENVTVTTFFTYDSNETQIQYIYKIPYLKITSASFLNFSPEAPFVNVTLRNSEFSKINATITHVNVTIGNQTLPLADNIGYTVVVNSSISIANSWKWDPYIGSDVTISVQTTDDMQVSATFRVEAE